MTLVQALYVLHRAGKIDAVWRPGMRVLLPAMIVGWLPVRADGFGRWRWEDGRICEVEPDERADLDTEDPATVGILAAIGRAALGKPRLVPDVHRDVRDMPGPDAWNIWDPTSDEMWPSADTEGGAWEAVIITAASAL